MSKKAANADNLNIWAQAYSPDKEHVKSYTGPGGFSGTSTKALWVFQKATELFGPFGQGWGVQDEEFIIESLGPELTDKMLVYRGVLWYDYGAKRGHIPMAANRFFYQRQRLDQDIYKKIRTNGIRKALSWLGFAAEVVLGIDDELMDLAAQDSSPAQSSPAPKKAQQKAKPKPKAPPQKAESAAPVKDAKPAQQKKPAQKNGAMLPAQKKVMGALAPFLPQKKADEWKAYYGETLGADGPRENLTKAEAAKIIHQMKSDALIFRMGALERYSDEEINELLGQLHGEPITMGEMLAISEPDCKSLVQVLKRLDSGLAQKGIVLYPERTAEAA